MWSMNIGPIRWENVATMTVMICFKSFQGTYDKVETFVWLDMQFEQQENGGGGVNFNVNVAC